MQIGRMLVVIGLAIAAIGVLTMLMGKAGLPPGRLPGDVTWRGRNTTVYFPWVTCLVLSVLGTLVLWLLNRR